MFILDEYEGYMYMCYEMLGYTGHFNWMFIVIIKKILVKYHSLNAIF